MKYFNSTLRPVFAIAGVTFQEIIRDKVLYNIVLFAILLFGVSYAASELTFITPERVILDIGFSAINISCGMVAVFNGCAMLAKEFDRRTVFVALARPISRLQFAYGKFIGLCFVITLNWLLLCLMEGALFHFQGGVINSSFFIALFFLLLQSFVLAALAVFMSSFTTTSIAVIILIGTYMLGNNITEVLKLVDKVFHGAPRLLFHNLTYILPNFERFNLGFHVTYLLPISTAMIMISLLYSLFLIVTSLYLGGIFLNRREG